MSFIDSSNKRRRSPNYSPTTAAPSLRTPSPDYMPVSLQWRRRVQDARVVSTTLRLRPSPPRRATSPDYSPPSSPSNKCLAEHDATLCSFCSVTHSLDYAPSTQLPSLHARKVYAALVRCGGTVRSPEYVPSAKKADHVRSPDYTPVSRFWTSGGPTVSTTSDDQATGEWSPSVAPASIHPQAASPDYTPRARSARATPRHGAGAP